jgi:phage tail sheath protein FI
MGTLMVMILYPGVFVQEVAAATKPIAGVSLSTTAFIGVAHKGTQNEPILISSYAQFEQHFGDRSAIVQADGSRAVNYLAYAAQGFFNNGGKKLYVVRIATASIKAYQQALHILEPTADIGMVALPGYSTLPVKEYAGLTQILVQYAEKRRDRMILIDPPPASDQQQLLSIRNMVNSSFAAIYAPWLMVRDRHSKRALALPPSGFVAGVIARVDATRGIYKAPANEVIQRIVGLERNITETEQSVLNPQGVNVLRSLPDRSYRIWGARTASAEPEWKYLSVRRYFTYLEKSIEQGTAWAVYEPNTQALWSNLRGVVENFLLSEWRKGALQGSKPDQAYFVRIDRSTMTQNDIDQGRVIMLVGFAPLKPAEFVLLRIMQQTRK